MTCVDTLKSTSFNLFVFFSVIFRTFCSLVFPCFNYQHPNVNFVDYQFGNARCQFNSRIWQWTCAQFATPPSKISISAGFLLHFGAFPSRTECRMQLAAHTDEFTILAMKIQNYKLFWKIKLYDGVIKIFAS